MEKINHIVITRKEEKALKHLERLFEIMGIDLPKMVEKIEGLEAENKSLREENASLRKEVGSIREENEQLIRDEMKKIAVNIQRSTSKDGTGKQIGKFNFTGKSIDETY